MLLQIAFWLLVVLTVCWLLIGPVNRVTRIARDIFVSAFNSNPVDLRTMFGDWAVVTGSTDGIGKAYAKELAARKINLVLISRNLEKLQQTKEEILTIDPDLNVKLIVADFSEGKAVFKKIESELKDVPVGILVNNVGKQYSYPMYLGEVPEDELWDIINVNTGAVTLMTRLIITGMQERRKGAIVNISSGSEFQPLPLMTVYAATKFYIKSFSEAVRAEYSRFGITVQHLTPLFVNTKMNWFSSRLRVTNVFVPDATTYARNAICTLGKVDCSSGYWGHAIQQFFQLIPPTWLRTRIGQIMNEGFRQEYFAQQKCK